MKQEFERYQLESYRRLTGALELLGGFGLIVGLKYSPVLILSSAGLSTLMFLGVLTRIRIRDPFLACIPALFLFGLNLAITFLSVAIQGN